MSRAQGSGAAALVPLLLAFLREPARERPRYTAGREPLEGGDHVMRFAQGRFPPQVIAKTTPTQRIELREAALAFIRQVCLWNGATHYQVLCVRPDARREEVKENYHLLMALIHPDRRDADSVSWPEDGAQRANHAYAILVDEEKRREYDATLEQVRAAHVPYFGIALPRARLKPRARWRRGAAAFAVVLAVVAVALMALDPPGSDDERESRLLGRWERRSDADAGSSRTPRFLNGSPRARPHESLLATKAPLELPVLAPLLRVLSLRDSPREDRRVALAASAPSPVTEPAQVLPAAEVQHALPATQAAAPEPATAAPAQSQAALPGPRLTARDIESMVVRLIDSYEAGRVDDLMELIDPRDAGFWSMTLMRDAYSQFFLATRERHLRVANLDWQATGHSAKAHGEARLHAEYNDERGTLDGPVSIDLEIALRDGRPRIVRLRLFPNAS